MFKTIFKYATLVTLFNKYKNKLFLLLSLVGAYFLIDRIYTDVQQYLSGVHPEYLAMALWIKSISLIVLFIALILAFKPKKETTQDISASDKTEVSLADQELIDKLSNKPILAANEFTIDCDGTDSSLSTDDIVNKIRNKRNLETRADKILRKLENGGD